ncbi:MAG: hypothetical protein JJ900_14580 [Rhodospirillales bacterium]|nr:hypothetical protein [Rhodospirillales bacterium]MBO6788070.1 hypothetical protein [Rhodospirillales bacterium]
MALEVSVIASAERLQAQRDQRQQLALSRQREEAVQRARDAERLAEERRRADATAADIDRARVQREFERGVADANRIDSLIARDAEDRRIDERLQQEEDDLQQFYADEQDRQVFLNAAEDALPPLTPTAPQPAPEAQDVAASPSAGDDRFAQLLSDRASRLAERAEADRQFGVSQTRDFAQSVRSIEELQTNPTSFPSDPPRGSVVDFSA